MFKPKENLKMKVSGFFLPLRGEKKIFWRIRFSASSNGRQVAVVTYFSKSRGYTVSIPKEGMDGWQVKIYDWNGVKRLVKRELNPIGRLVNRLIFFPLALISGRLS